MPSYNATARYFSADFPRQLFPLDTNRIVIEHAAESIGAIVYDRITHTNDSQENFLAQVRTYGAKHGFHLRRTLKLDPIAEFFLYDLTYRHRAAFRRGRSDRRRNFGYRFVRGRMISPARSYRRFRASVHEALDTFLFCIKADISQYFNSLYHHDLVTWFREHANTPEDAEFLGKFLRQINSGRSVDCLPQGIYPAKIIGSQFLKFVDDSNRLKSRTILRFMDDIYLFDNREDILKHDFHQLQRLLGEKGLSVNASKTKMIGEVDELDMEQEVDDVKARLLERRGEIVFGSGVDEGDDDEDEDLLDDEAVDYLLELLRDEHLEEEDAELVLAVMRKHSADVMEFVPTLLHRFPALSKSIFYFSAHVEDTAELLGFVEELVRTSEFISEFQLFWLAKTCEEYLLNEDGVGDVLAALFEHSSATIISKAKVLEIPESRFGMPDLREEELRAGASGWLAWTAAVGSRDTQRARRNHLLKYFGNASSINRLIADCVRTL